MTTAYISNPLSNSSICGIFAVEDERPSYPGPYGCSRISKN